jgi:hypothetical protein
VSAVRAAWSSASFLIYAGGLTLLFALVWLLIVLGEDYRDAAFVGWSALLVAILAVAAAATRRAGHSLVAGLLALSAVVAITIFVGALEDWFGWLDDFGDSPFSGFRPAFLFLELVAAAASLVALSIFRFPLLVAPAVGAGSFFVIDLLSGGGNWSAIVSIGVGLLLLLIGLGVDGDPETQPYGLWIHVASGFAIGAGLLWFFHEGDLDWILIGLASLGYILLGDRLLRSSWVVLGAWALLQTTTHFVEKWSTTTDLFPFLYFVPFFLFSSFDLFGDEGGGREWLGPLLYAAYALMLVAMGVWLARRRRALPAP